MIQIIIVNWLEDLQNQKKTYDALNYKSVEISEDTEEIAGDFRIFHNSGFQPIYRKEIRNFKNRQCL